LTVDYNGHTLFNDVVTTVDTGGRWQSARAAGTWNNARREITLINTDFTDVFPAKLVGRKTAKGINNRRRPGQWYAQPGDTTPSGTWYAVAMPSPSVP
jgi:hypothetical protein